MKLKLLLEELNEKNVFGEIDGIDVKGMVYDPLRVKAGFMFVAINIYTQLDKIEIPDGHDKVNEAIEAGAKIIVLQRDMELPDSVIKIVVPDSRYALAILANRAAPTPLSSHPRRRRSGLRHPRSP